MTATPKAASASSAISTTAARRGAGRAAAKPAPSPAGERNRAQTEARIVAAVGEVLAESGFGAVGVNAIAKRAGIDKVLIYRYFGGLPELLTAWGASGRFWPGLDELLGDDPAAFLALPAAERYARFMEHFVDGLRARPLTLEILAAEVVQRNELTAILEAEREAWGEQASRLLAADEFAARPELQPLTLLLIAGVQYLLVRSRKIRIFGGVEIQTDAGWATLKAAVRRMAFEMVGAGGADAAPTAALTPALSSGREREQGPSAEDAGQVDRHAGHRSDRDDAG